MPAFRDRIKSFRRVKAADLIENEKNWRGHSEKQTAAMRGLLEEVGFSNAVLAYETDEGLKLIDGHLRAKLDPDAKVPVLVLDVTEEEADLILATHDPLMSLGKIDQDKFDELSRSISSDNEAVAGLLSELTSTAVTELEVRGDDGDEESDSASTEEPQVEIESNESEKEEAGDMGADKAQAEGEWSRTDYIFFRKFEIAFTGEDADAFESAIKKWIDKAGTTHGFVAHIAERI